MAPNNSYLLEFTSSSNSLPSNVDGPNDLLLTKKIWQILAVEFTSTIRLQEIVSSLLLADSLGGSDEANCCFEEAHVAGH